MKYSEKQSLFVEYSRLTIGFLMVTLLHLSVDLKSQESSRKSLSVYPSVGLGIGVVKPKDVFRYYEHPNWIIFGEGQSYYTAKGGITFRLKRADFNVLLEYDHCPVDVLDKSEKVTYAYNRIAPMISANKYLPVGKGRHAFFLGVGIEYSFMKFSIFDASGAGFRIQAGFSLQFNEINIQPHITYLYTNARDTSDPLPVWGSFVLNYSSFQIGLLFSFHGPVNYIN